MKIAIHTSAYRTGRFAGVTRGYGCYEALSWYFAGAGETRKLLRAAPGRKPSGAGGRSLGALVWRFREE